MSDPSAVVADPVRGPRAEVMISLRGASPTGLARTVAVLAATPAVDGVVLAPDALVDFGAGLWAQRHRSALFTAVLLGRSGIDDLVLSGPLPSEPTADPDADGAAAPAVVFLSATPITANEAAWVRLKGADAMREAWSADGVDVLDPARGSSQSQ
jgi:hypothetical protein